jgi:hypothetical protein
MMTIEINPDFANNVYVSTLDKLNLKLEISYKEPYGNGGWTSRYGEFNENFFEKLDHTKFVDSKVGHGKEEVLNKDVRSSKIMKKCGVRVIGKYESYRNELNPKTIKPISHSLECKIPSNMDLIKYESGDHFNEFHFDTYKKEEIATVLIFPPYNIFTGGNLVFKLEDKIFSLDTSKFSDKDFTIVIFADILHKCEPIESGTRFVFKTSVESSMPKILSDDLKFKMADVKNHKSNKNIEDYKKKNEDKIANIEQDLEKAIDVYFNFKRDYVKENLPDDFDDEFEMCNVRRKLSEYKTDYKRLLQQLQSLKSLNINMDKVKINTIYENTYKIYDDVPNICVLSDYIENNTDINNYDEYEVAYIKTMLEKGYNIVPLYMKIQMKTDFEEGWRKIYGTSPIDVSDDDYDYYNRKYNLQYTEGWVTNGKQLDYHSEYNDQSGDDIYEEYECSCLLIWK